jgi:hypothetical protein
MTSRPSLPPNSATGGFEVADLRLQGRPGTVHDVRRIREDRVERTIDGVEPPEQIAGPETDAAADAVTIRVAPRHLQRRRRDVAGDDGRARPFVGDRDGHAAASGADIGDRQRRVAVGEQLEHGLHDQFGRRPGNEDVRVDLELQTQNSRCPTM